MSEIAAAPVTSTPTPTSTESLPQSQESVTPAPSEIFDVKVNGKVVKMTRQEVLDHASMSHTANSKFDEASKQRKQIDKILTTAKTNPIEALMDPALGLTKDQIRLAFEKWYNDEFIAPESLNEDQKKVRQYEAELKKYKETEEAKKKQDEQDETEKLTAQQRQYLQAQIIEAMDASGLPKTKFFVSRMAFYMRQNVLNGWEAPIDMIVKQVKNERQEMMADFSDGSTAEQLIALLGDGVINKIRQHDLKQLRDKRQTRAPQSQYFGNSTPNQPNKVSYSEVQQRLNQMRQGKF